MQKILNKLLHPIDDSAAQQEWGWEAEYGQEQIVDDFIAEMRSNGARRFDPSFHPFGALLVLEVRGHRVGVLPAT